MQSISSILKKRMIVELPKKSEAACQAAKYGLAARGGVAGCALPSGARGSRDPQIAQMAKVPLSFTKA
jgi:hypothetical protein